MKKAVLAGVSRQQFILGIVLVRFFVRSFVHSFVQIQIFSDTDKSYVLCLLGRYSICRYSPSGALRPRDTFDKSDTALVGIVHI